MPTNRTRRTRARIDTTDNELFQFLKTGVKTGDMDIDWTLFDPEDVFEAYESLKRTMGEGIRQTVAYEVFEKGTKQFTDYSWLSHHGYQAWKH